MFFRQRWLDYSKENFQEYYVCYILILDRTTQKNTFTKDSSSNMQTYRALIYNGLLEFANKLSLAIP